jgi:hypothetical protein
MLKANRIRTPELGRGLWFEVTYSGAAIATIDCTEYRKDAMFELDKRYFRVLVADFLEQTFQLRFGDTLIATASKQFFPERIRLAFGGREWMFRKSGIFNWKLTLARDGVPAGTILTGPWPKWYEGVTVDLPDDLPREVQMLLLYILLRWRNAA